MAELITNIDSLELNSKSSIIHACSYSNPITSIRLNPSEMPCNHRYQMATIQNDYLLKVNLTHIESFTALQVNKGKKCFKLELATNCIQRWFSANEITKTLGPMSFTREECLSGVSCVNCEVALEYPPEDCRTFTFGLNQVRKTVLFSSEVVLYQDKIGQTFYGGVSTYDQEINVGGQYATKIYFNALPVTEEMVGEFTINQYTNEMISYDLRRLIKPSNRTILFKNKNFTVYDEDILISTDELQSAILQTKQHAGDSSIISFRIPRYVF